MAESYLYEDRGNYVGKVSDRPPGGGSSEDLAGLVPFSIPGAAFVVALPYLLVLANNFKGFAPTPFPNLNVALAVALALLPYGGCWALSIWLGGRFKKKRWLPGGGVKDRGPEVLVLGTVALNGTVYLALGGLVMRLIHASRCAASPTLNSALGLAGFCLPFFLITGGVAWLSLHIGGNWPARRAFYVGISAAVIVSLLFRASLWLFATPGR